MHRRASGILLPVSALPGSHGIGNLGKAAFDFIDFLAECGQSYWQILPLGPTAMGDSPYQSFSTYAGNPYFIDLDILVDIGLLAPDDIRSANGAQAEEKIDYGMIYETRIPILRKAYAKATEELKHLGRDFVSNEPWLVDYALFMSLKGHFDGKAWYEWEEAYKYRQTEALLQFRSEHMEEFTFWCFVQFLFYIQWEEVKEYAHRKGILIIGDIPLYVAEDSVDVWANPECFQLDEELRPKVVAGYPPDAFSATGQLWGNPIYHWDFLKKQDYMWWQHRLVHQQRLYDVVRLDHFIGFDRYWAIPFGDKDATRGKWKDGPGYDFFRTIQKSHANLKLIAEDLGNVTESVRSMRIKAGLPSMRVMQFGFDPKQDSENLPHNFDREIVAYTGTHDNETINGWWQNLPQENKEFAALYLHQQPHENIAYAMLRALFASGAKLVIATMQDLLMQDNTARINEPNTMGNWTYRMPADYRQQINAPFMRQLTRIYRRIPHEFI